MTLDPRLHAFRDDVADVRLQGRVDAARFVEGTVKQVRDPLVTVHGEPRSDATCVTQALFGEQVTVFDEHEGWAWAQLDTDGYVGYLPADALTSEAYQPTHRVSVLSSYLYTGPTIKTQPAICIYLNSNVSVIANEGDFSRLQDGRYVWTRHISPLSEFDDDPATVAERYRHVPYLWGGKSQAGLDCSGLVQLAYHATGRECPRDSDMMQHSIGEPLLINDLSGLRRGDLIFWSGHVGMMLDNDRLIHANGYHMTTVIEPVAEAVSRIATLFGPVTQIRRPESD